MTLISATVEDAEPTKIILTFPSAQTSLVVSDFSLSDRSISSISWAGAILTLNLYTAVIYGDSIVITFNKTGQTANLTNNILPWYLASGLSSLDVVGAWKSCGVADQATSYVNQANPGTNDLTATGAVTWDKTTGWGSFDRTRYLTGPVYKTKTYSVIVLVKNVTPIGANYGRAISAEYDNGVHGMYVIPNLSNLADGGSIMNGSDYVLINDSPNSVIGVNQSSGFVDGLDVGEISPSGNEYEIAIRVGFATFPGASGQSLIGNVLAVAIYNKSISSDQMIAIQNKMKANEFIVGNLRSFTGLTRYASNPIIVHNTNEWNTVGSDTPFFNSISKIDSTYYALTQAATDYEAWNNILLYTSTDLVNWTLHANNPAIKNEASAWDDHYLIHPCIIKIADTWYAYYSAANVAGLHTVGCATSIDLITWTKHPSNPIYTPPAGRASVPFVILIGNTYFMYYWNRSTANVIKYATSPDGLTWTYVGDAVTSIESDWDYGYHLLDVWIVRNSNGLYEMVYTEYHGESGLIVQHIGYAVSWNGTKWYKKPEAILSKSGSGWEQGYVGDPVIFINDDGSANLYYAGMNDDDATANSDGGLAIIPK